MELEVIASAAAGDSTLTSSNRKRPSGAHRSCPGLSTFQARRATPTTSPSDSGSCSQERSWRKAASPHLTKSLFAPSAASAIGTPDAKRTQPSPQSPFDTPIALLSPHWPSSFSLSRLSHVEAMRSRRSTRAWPPFGTQTGGPVGSRSESLGPTSGRSANEALPPGGLAAAIVLTRGATQWTRPSLETTCKRRCWAASGQRSTYRLHDLQHRPAWHIRVAWH